MFDDLADPLKIVSEENKSIRDFFNLDQFGEDRTKILRMVEKLTKNFKFNIDKFRAYLSSSVRRYNISSLIFRAALSEKICPDQDEIIPVEFRIYQKITNLKTIPFDADSKMTVSTKLCSLIPEWFGSTIDLVCLSAFSNALRPFLFFMINNRNLLVQYSDRMDYSALFGGNMTIIKMLEQNGISFSHLEAAVRSHNNTVLEWALKNFQYDQQKLLKEAINSFNVKAIFLIHPDEIFISDDMNAVFIGAMSMIHKSKPSNRFLSDLEMTVLKNHKYFKLLEILNNQFPRNELIRDKLFQIFLEEVVGMDATRFVGFESLQQDPNTPHSKKEMKQFRKAVQVQIQNHLMNPVQTFENQTIQGNVQTFEKVPVQNSQTIKPVRKSVQEFIQKARDAAAQRKTEKKPTGIPRTITYIKHFELPQVNQIVPNPSGNEKSFKSETLQEPIEETFHVPVKQKSEKERVVLPLLPTGPIFVLPPIGKLKDSDENE